MENYSKEFKDKIIVQILPPNSESIIKISREASISQATLHRWKDKATKERFSSPAGKTTLN